MTSSTPSASIRTVWLLFLSSKVRSLINDDDELVDVLWNQDILVMHRDESIAVPILPLVALVEVELTWTNSISFTMPPPHTHRSLHKRVNQARCRALRSDLERIAHKSCIYNPAHSKLLILNECTHQPSAIPSSQVNQSSYRRYSAWPLSFFPSISHILYHTFACVSASHPLSRAVKWVVGELNPSFLWNKSLLLHKNSWLHTSLHLLIEWCPSIHFVLPASSQTKALVPPKQQGTCLQCEMFTFTRR